MMAGMTLRKPRLPKRPWVTTFAPVVFVAATVVTQWRSVHFDAGTYGADLAQSNIFISWLSGDPVDLAATAMENDAKIEFSQTWEGFFCGISSAELESWRWQQVLSELRWPRFYKSLEASKGESYYQAADGYLLDADLYENRLALPLWMPALLFAALAGRGWYRYRPFRRPGRCPCCGYDLTGNVSGVCPECGHEVAAAA